MAPTLSNQASVACTPVLSSLQHLHIPAFQLSMPLTVGRCSLTHMHREHGVRPLIRDPLCTVPYPPSRCIWDPLFIMDLPWVPIMCQALGWKQTLTRVFVHLQGAKSLVREADVHQSICNVGQRGAGGKPEGRGPRLAGRVTQHLRPTVSQAMGAVVSITWGQSILEEVAMALGNFPTGSGGRGICWEDARM